MQMILSGKLYSGKDAFDLGLIHNVVPPDALHDETAKMLTPIFRNPQYALSLAKRAVRAVQSHTLTEGLKVENEAFSQCFDQDYFVKLMIQQLKSGELKTTARLPDWVVQEGKKSE
jgi:enoyl-CoA hydratase/carnithine racemase